MLQAPSFTPMPDVDALSEAKWILPLQILHRHRVEHVVAGEAADAAYGSSPAAQAPLTVVPAPYGRNLDRLTGALRELRAVGATVEVTHRPAGTDGFRDLLADARPVTIAGFEVLVTSAEDLTRMREAAGS